ncbi:MAG: TIGR03862 family flavoprotein [Gammaproteobacteria bacterium]|nr:TIGR03862 family flavoprotein [Rhodocyclaceae bacterium]MBU3909786.1 TIGR03862 family flavoprotein [Gammaproteobacteria bacterium]MBU3990652.1 TIGR03862 family flavoprotein [Gammaproteobacteria bacterium]MBU4005319.1 TIGR03862 family flavoprotein [Gammaproteobacteria bacterium]MBU4022497.1 TIGR03862 family flavoprotein [Gammaproteobacteria bacterium]
MQRKGLIIGGGPAGLMAAEVLSQAGLSVEVYDAMPSVGRKFLMAGKSGLNLTHAEALDTFVSRYGKERDWVGPWLASFGPVTLRSWARDLGVDTFVGSSGRVFPAEMKAAPLLRAWLSRLRAAGVRFHMRHRWLGWDEDGALRFATPTGEQKVGVTEGNPRGTGGTAVILALGGGSWAKLGSNGAWVPLLQARGVAIAPLKPANCGFEIAWSEHFRTKFAGQPVKSVVATFDDAQRQGDFVITEHGIEGSLIYTFSAPLRDAIESHGSTKLQLDLAPGKTLERLTREIAHPRGARSMASHLQSRAGIAGVKAGLLRECAAKDDYADPARLAAAIKALPLRLDAPRPLDEAISTAGGVMASSLDDRLMLNALPGTFCAGEMLDWEAPTGGYLLTACFASGYAAGHGAMAWLQSKRSSSATN